MSENQPPAADEESAGDPNKAASESQQPTPAPVAGKPSRSGLPVAIIALLLVLIALGGGYYLWLQLQRMDGQLGQTGQHLSEYGTQSDAMRGDFEQRVGQLREELQRVRSEQQAVNDALADMRTRADRSQDGWVLAEADYLMRVAGQRLLLQRDVATAMAALSAADGRLRTLGDPGLIPVREQLANEITALRAVAQPDREGLALTLSSFAQRVDQLPLAAAEARTRVGEDTQAAGAAAPESWRDWHGVLRAIWAELRKLVVVRHSERATSPMLAPQEQFFLVENLRLQLESARLALLLDDPQAYAGGARTAAQWLRTHFDGSDAGVANMAAELERLSAIDLRPELPDISGSLRKLKAHRARLGEPVEGDAQSAEPQAERP